ncbi:MAG: hypothetical protein ABIK92_21890 [Pseudomonadota bacterium]
MEMSAEELQMWDACGEPDTHCRECWEPRYMLNEADLCEHCADLDTQEPDGDEEKAHRIVKERQTDERYP